uniref:Uncharacterized protein n=1 Tax=Quercus lobata TaxID=97700 RepID=A0A7N2RBS6_QUELO
MKGVMVFPTQIAMLQSVSYVCENGLKIKGFREDGKPCYEVDSDVPIFSITRKSIFIPHEKANICSDTNAFVRRIVVPILNAFYGLRDEPHGFFQAFHALIAFLVSFLAALIGLHFQVLSISPLETHFATVLLFIMAAILYSIAYMEIKLQPQGAEYLLLFRFFCLVSGIIAVELLISIIISPFWLFMVNFLQILIVGMFAFSCGMKMDLRVIEKIGTSESTTVGSNRGFQ